MSVPMLVKQSHKIWVNPLHRTSYGYYGYRVSIVDADGLGSQYKDCIVIPIMKIRRS